jgi:KaiC/GvpD/RAD55 family RecA-like ATPase
MQVIQYNAHEPQSNNLRKYSWNFIEHRKEWQFTTTEVKRIVHADSVEEFAQLEANQASLVEDGTEFVSHIVHPSGKRYGNFYVSGPICGKTNELPAGMYILPDAPTHYTSSGLKFTNFRDNTHYDIGNPGVAQLYELVKEFRNEKKIPGTMRKANALLYGPPGNGKTSILENIAKDWVKEGGVVIFMPGQDKYMNQLKMALKDREVMVIVEEITNMMGQGDNGLEAPAWLLSQLDGQSSLDNSMTFVTTNYPELLPPNLVDRVGRFQDLIEISNPTVSEIRKYLTIRGVPADLMDGIIERCNGFNLDFLINLTNHVLRGTPLAEIYAKLERHNMLAEKHFSKRIKIGIEGVKR